MIGIFDGETAAGIVTGIWTMMGALGHTDYNINMGFLDNPGPEAPEEAEALYTQRYDGTEEEMMVLAVFPRFIPDVLANYIVEQDQPERIIPYHNAKPRANHGYVWWIQDPLTELWNMYEFQSTHFIRGFLSICHAFQVDSHDCTRDLWRTAPGQEPEHVDYREPD
jgi:hypothetical protein